MPGGYDNTNVFTGKYFEPGMELTGISLLELAPTIAWLTECTASREWEGKMVCQK